MEECTRASPAAQKGEEEGAGRGHAGAPAAQLTVAAKQVRLGRGVEVPDAADVAALLEHLHLVPELSTVMRP